MILKKILFLILFLFCLQNIFAVGDEEKLITAIENNNLQEIKLQIQDKKQANLVIDKLPILCYAAYIGRDSIAKYLISKGADIMWDNGEDYSVLHAASSSCMSWLVERILNNSTKQVNLHKKNEYPTPIELAAFIGCDSTVMQLLQIKKVVNKGLALEVAIKNKHLSTARILIESMSPKELKSNEAQLITYSYKYPDTSAIELLLNNGVNINTNLSEDKSGNVTLLQMCLEGRKAEFVKFCLLHDADYKQSFKYRVYGSSPQELPALDYIFTAKYIKRYSPEWMEVANLLIDIAAEKNELSLIISDYKKVIDLAISENYTPVLFNLIYQGEKTGLKIILNDGSEIMPSLYIENFDGKNLSQEDIEFKKEVQQIFGAIDTNNIKRFKKLFHPENYYNYNGCSRTVISNNKEESANILDYAIYTGSYDIVKYIISEELFGTIGDKHYYMAVNSNHVDIFELLIKSDKNFKNTGKWILYHIDKPQFVEILLKNGVNADEYIFNGQSFLFYEFRYGSVENINLLLEYSTETDKQYKALFFAIEKNDLKTIEKIIKSGIDINHSISGGLTPLCWAAYLGRYDAAKLLIDNKANVSASWRQNEGYSYPIYGTAPLRWAVEKGQADMVKLLIEHKASPIINIFNQEGLTLFHLAAAQGSVEIMKILIAAYENENSEQDKNVSSSSDYYNGFYDFNDAAKYNYMVATPFDVAAYNGNIELCKLFLELGLGVDNPKKAQYNHYTPLYFAVEGGQVEIVKFLIEGGALISDGILVNSAFILNSDAIKSVVSAGGNQINLGTVSYKFVRNILRNQHINDYVEIIDYLSNHGLDINAKNDQGASVLYLAVEADNSELVHLLIDKGCKIEKVVDKGENSLECKLLINKDILVSYSMYKVLKDYSVKCDK